MMHRGALCLLAGVIVSGCDAGQGPNIPVYNSAGAEPQVVERLRSLREVVQNHPDSAPAWGLLALSFQAHDFSEAAVQAYAEARSRRPGTFAYVYLPAIILADRADPEAGELFAEARSLRPNYVPLRLHLATWELDQGHPAMAIELLGDRIVLKTAGARAHLILARAALAQNDLARARAFLDEGLVIAPRFGDLHALSAELFRRGGDPDRAELEELRAQTFRGEPSVEDPVLAALYSEGISFRWHILRGQGNLAAGRPQEALVAFEQAVAARPSDAHGWNQRGISLQALGRSDEAVDSFQRALELRPEFAEATSNLAMSLFSGGDMQNGLDVAHQAIDQDSTATQGYLYLGMFEQAMGRPDRAREAYSRGISVGTFDIRIGIRLSWILSTSRNNSLRDGRRAVVLAESVNEIEGYDQPASLDALAAAYAEYGAFNRALTVADRARSIAEQQAQPSLAATIEQRRRLYAQSQPYRE